MDSANIVVLVVLLVLVGLGSWFFIALVRAFSSAPSRGVAESGYTGTDADLDGMNEGDIHNGPHGYSPMTAYPETQYGSGFDPDAEWNER